MWEIYAYQNADSLFGIFNAAAAINASSDYLAAVAAVAFCGFVLHPFLKVMAGVVRDRFRTPNTDLVMALMVALFCAATRFMGGSLNARATRIEAGRWNTSAVGPYCSSSPASSTAV